MHQAKLVTPAPRRGHAPRKVMRQLIEHLRSHRIVLLEAPPGYGKTTLAADWARSAAMPVAWLSLDRADNDPHRFWRLMQAALERAAPERFAAAAGEAGRLEAAAASIAAPLIDRLAEWKEPFALIIDDIHLMDDAVIHEGVRGLLKRLPAKAYVLLMGAPAAGAARSWLHIDKPAVIGTADMTLGTADIRQFAAAAGLANALPGHEAQRLRRLSGGCAALLVSLTDRSSAYAPPGRRHGATFQMRLVAYILEDARRLPEEDRKALACLALCGRVSAALCEALTGLDDCGPILQRLHAAHPLVSRLEADAVWYGCHDILRTALASDCSLLQQESCAGLDELRRKAAQWFAARRLMHEAVEYALDGQCLDLASAYINELAPGMLGSGQAAALERWLQRVPPERRGGTPELALALAWTEAAAGRMEQAAAALTLADSALANSTQADPDRPQLALDLRAAKAYMCAVRGDHAAADALAATYEALPLRPRYMPRTAPGCELQPARGPFGCMGRPALAQRMYAPFRSSALPLPAGGFEALVLADVAYERNMLGEALRYSREALSTGLAARDADIFVPAALLAMRICAALLDSDGQADARQLLLHGLEQLGPEPQPRWAELLAAYNVREALKGGLGRPLLEWEKQCGLKDNEPEVPEKFYQYSTLIRIRLWQSRTADAIALIQRCRPPLKARNYVGHMLELDVLEAMALAKSGEMAAAATVLEEVLREAKSEGCVRMLVDEGREALRLLHRLKLRLKRKEPELAKYADALIDAFRRLPTAAATDASTQQNAANTAENSASEAFSRRELDILGGLALGLTYTQISERLGLSEGTVKIYKHKLFVKLGARSKAQALQQARDAGLIR